MSLGFNGDFDNPEFAESIAVEGIDLKCTVEEYQSKSREKWEFAGWASAIEPAAEDKLKRLNARWNATASKAQSPVMPVPAPPPSPKTSTPPPAPATATRESAWQTLFTNWSADKSEDELRALWQKVIDECGKPESEFTAEDWAAVQESVKLPF